MADNGSTDGSPEEALERFPNTRLLRTGGNLGYGTAVNRAVAELRGDCREPGSLHRRQPRRAMGTGQHRRAAGGGGSLADGGLARPADPRPRRFGLPVGAAPAQHRPRRHARGDRSGVAVQPVDGGLPAGPAPAQRTSGRLVVGIVLLLRGEAFDQVGGFDERYFMYMEDVDLEIGSSRPAGGTCTSPRRRFCTTRATPPAAIPPATWPRTTAAPTLSWLIGTTSGGRRR